MNERSRLCFVAHRAAEPAVRLAEAAARADRCELDLHLGPHGTIEVRHAKRLWPSRRLWERWYVLPAGHRVATLDEILAAAPPGTAWWFDLKGVSPRLTRRLLPYLDTRTAATVTVSSKSWWLLAPLAGRAGVRTFRSAGNRAELALLLRWPGRAGLSGAVVRRSLLDAPLRKRLAARGLVATWGVTSEADIAALAAEGTVDSVIVDDLSLIHAEPDRH